MASERAPDTEGVFNLPGHLRVRLSTTRANPRWLTPTWNRAPVVLSADVLCTDVKNHRKLKKRVASDLSLALCLVNRFIAQLRGHKSNVHVSSETSFTTFPKWDWSLVMCRCFFLPFLVVLLCLAVPDVVSNVDLSSCMSVSHLLLPLQPTERASADTDEHHPAVTLFLWILVLFATAYCLSPMSLLPCRGLTADIV